MKTVWRIGQDTEARHPGQNVAIGFEVFRHACRPGANVQAVFYRSSLIWMMSQFAPEQLAQFMREGQPTDAVFRAASKVPAEWVGVGIPQQGLPFDVNEFLRLCGEVKN